MSCEPNRSPRSWRRFLRFGLRGLIVVVLLIAAGLGWIVRQAHIQRDAVVAIKNAGGFVMYDWEWDGGKRIPGGKPGAPRWLIDLIGIDYFGHVTYVELFSATDATLAHVGRLTRLQTLRVASPAVSDSGLVHLKGLTKLSVLWLDYTRITDSGLAHLEGLTNLSVLWLVGNIPVTDSGLVHLKGLTNLTELWLDGNQVTDAGLVHVKGLTKLSQLYLSSTRVTDAGVQELKRALASLTINR